MLTAEEMKQENWQVYKFGGTSLADGTCLEQVCGLIHQNVCPNLIVLVSAMAGVTDSLLKVAQTKHLEPINPFLDLYQQTVENLINNPLSLTHISEPTRRYAIPYSVFCLKKKT